MKENRMRNAMDRSSRALRLRYASLVLVGSLLLAVAIAPASNAALNGDHGFDLNLSYEAVGSKDVTLLSGSLDASMAGTTEPMLFVGMGDGALTGLTKVCWSAPTPDCRQDASGAITVSWQSGASLAFKFPSPAAGSATADHAIVLFLDPEKDLTFGDSTVHFGPTMAALAVGGQMAFGALADIPDTPLQDINANNAGGMLSLSDGTRFTVSGPGFATTFSSQHDSITFQGHPAAAPFAAQGIVVPFKGSSLHMGRADGAAAATGLDTKHIQDLIQQVTAETGGDGQSVQLPDLGPLGGVQASVLNGALVRVAPGNGTTDPSSFVGEAARGLTLIRFDNLAATGGSSVDASGAGPLHIEAGRVVDAQPLIGFAWFQLPWWSYVLWILAIGAFVARIVLKAPKKNERWDRLRWIGWIAGPVALLIFFLLWDNEVHSVFGVSLLSGGASGPALGVVALVEFLPLSIVFFAVVTPLRILLRSGLRLLKQGTFMGLAGPSATLLGFLLGATLMLSYFDLVLRQISGS